MRYLLRDKFSSDLSAGSVNGTPSTPGPGNRVVTDTSNFLSISNGELIASAAAATGNPRCYIGSVSRQLGRLGLVNIFVPSTGGPLPYFGFRSTTGGQPDSNAFFFSSTSLLSILDSSAGPVVTTYSQDTNYQLAIALKAAGAFYFIKGGAFSNWTLLWIGDTNALPDLFLGVAARTAGARWDDLRSPDVPFIPVPVARDTFTRANGGLGNTELVGAEGQQVAARAWADSVGTWAITSNAAGCSALSGSIGIATYDCGKLDVLHEVTLTRSAGNVGVVIRYADDQNYIIGYHDGTNVKVDKIVGGVTTAVLTAGMAYSAGRILRLVMYGTKIRAFYNGQALGGSSEGTISDAALQTGTRVGLYTTNTGNTVDNVATLARGSGGEYSELDVFQ